MNEFKDVKKILVIKLRHIGDVLLAVPAVRALKESFPGARVSALVNSGTEDMLTLNPLIEEVITFNRSVKGLSIAGRTPALACLKRGMGELKFVKDLRARGFDMTVDLTGGDRPALMGFLIGARYRLGCDPMGKGFAGKKYLYTHLAGRPAGRLHTVLRDLALVRSFGIDTADLTVDIFTSAADDSFVKRLLEENGVKPLEGVQPPEGVQPGEPFVHVHPTSRWFFKCWKDEAMAEVMDMLQMNGFKTVITAAPDDREMKRAASVISRMRTRPIDLSGKLNLKQMAALSRSSVMFLGVDSAPMHIAAACGARVVGIFGPSGAFDWGPWDNKAASEDPSAAYPQKNGVQCFGANTVIQKDWDCVPCGKDGCKGTKKSDCLDAIEAAEVWKMLKDKLGVVR
ncbi:MAG: putative lipopolysaccharide heptosyltransferase III [Deltaproteobacteria bacterium]|nr:putative lipopolysaccharide heptosyltransferase III [Deltaproteobacteria bacterium]